MANVAVHTSITDRVAVLTLSHPARRNALNIALSALLAEAVPRGAGGPRGRRDRRHRRGPGVLRERVLAELATAGPARLEDGGTAGSSPSRSARCRRSPP